MMMGARTVKDFSGLVGKALGRITVDWLPPQYARILYFHCFSVIVVICVCVCVLQDIRLSEHIPRTGRLFRHHVRK